jgi:hypothetical protein
MQYCSLTAKKPPALPLGRGLFLCGRLLVTFQGEDLYGRELRGRDKQRASSAVWCSLGVS